MSILYFIIYILDIYIYGLSILYYYIIVKFPNQLMIHYWKLDKISISTINIFCSHLYLIFKIFKKWLYNKLLYMLYINLHF